MIILFMFIEDVWNIIKIKKGDKMFEFGIILVTLLVILEIEINNINKQ